MFDLNLVLEFTIVSRKTLSLILNRKIFIIQNFLFLYLYLNHLCFNEVRQSFENFT